MEENLNLNEGQESVVDSQNDTTGVTDAALETSESVTGEAAAPQKETKPVQSAEENARFAEVRRKAEAEAKDKMIDEMFGVSHGIHTYAEYQAAIAKQQEEERLNELLNEGISEKFATELLENRKFREQYEAEQKIKQQQEQQQADMKDFIETFPDVKAEDIPVEVWQANARGIPLRYAYAEHALKLAREAEAKAKANTENAKGSMGSVNGDGVANEQDFVTFDEFEKNKSNATWVAKNYNKIQKSRPNW